ncbi:MAG TPA: protein phosphatase 2C domain-containing protein [Polyangiaceae bacterium]|jgi:protein phosphatase|nr:protein phosphatase 2C domain-containing protein [Polyangiaceae bacterium]
MQVPEVGGSDDPVVSGRALSVVAAGATDIGQRDHNEDQVLLRPELGLFLLADGAGGHNAGNVASALATTTVANVFETTAATLADRAEVDSFGLWTVARRLSSAMHQANAEIIDIAKKSEKYHGMGTTLVAIAFSPAGDMIHVAHVGDSRCYRMRARQLEPLTVDHSLIVDVLEAYPDADDVLLARTPQNVVTRALGMEESLRVPVRTLPALPGDVYLLCSDGVTDVLDDEALASILSDAKSPDALVQTVIEAALAGGAQDNVAAVVVACRETDVLPRRRPSARPEPMLAARAPAGSAPEIIIVGVETHIVPSESVDATLLDALGRLARLRQPLGPGLGVTPPSRCSSCGQPLQRGATTCPTCSAPIIG